MNEICVLVSYESGCEVLAAFTDKSLIEEYVARLCDDGESSEARGEQCPDHELAVWSVALDDPRFIRESLDSRENTKTKEVHVLSNGFGEILGAFTDKSLLEKSVAYPPEDECQYCESYEARGEECPYRQSFIDTVALDDPILIAYCKERIAQVRAGIRG